MEQINTADVDDKDVLEGLFRENKEILDFLSSGLANNKQNQTPTRSQEKLGEISEEKESNDDVAGEFKIRLHEVFFASFRGQLFEARSI